MSQRRMTEVSRPPEYASTTFLTDLVTLLSTQQGQDDGLLRVQAILGLVEDQAARPVEHRVGDLLASVRGQAVHHDRLTAGEVEQPVVDLVALEGLQAPLAVALLAHADRAVGVDHVGLLDRFARLGGHLHAAAHGTTGLQHLRVRLVPGRARHHRGRAEHRAQQQERVADVVAVAHPGQAQLGEIDPALVEREEVGHRLTGVLEVGQSVDHRDGGVGREPFERRVREHAGRHPVDPPGEVARHVGNRLALAHPDLLRGQVDPGPAELHHRDIEGHAGAQRRLLEDQGQAAPGQGRPPIARLLPGLQLGGQREEAREVLPGQVANRQEVLHWLTKPLSTWSMISPARRTVASPVTKGGASRRALSPALSTRRPRSRQAPMTSPTGGTRSLPTSSPRPRTAVATFGYRARTASSWLCSTLPVAAARSGSRSSMRGGKTAKPTAGTNGLPPKVEPWVPGVNADATLSVARVAPIGTPLASALASVMMSGSIPECS